MRLPVHSASPIPARLALPMNPSGPRSPVIVTGTSPCCVGTLNSSLSVLPVIVPLTGTPPARLVSVPVTLSLACVNVALPGIWFPPMLNVMSHLPEISPPPAAAGAGVANAACDAGRAEVGLRFAAQGTWPRPPKSRLPVIASPATVPVIVISMELPWRFSVYETLRASLTTVPLKSTEPMGLVTVPVRPSPTCFKVRSIVEGPWGDSTVTSQSPVTSVCANAAVEAQATIAIARRHSLVRLIALLSSGPELPHGRITWVIMREGPREVPDESEVSHENAPSSGRGGSGGDGGG